VQTDQPVIQLTSDDYKKCVEFTNLNMEWVDKNNAQTKYGQANDLETRHRDTLQGYLGEEAFAKSLNYTTVWTPYNKTAYDVLGYEVRTVKYPNAILITHHDDKPAPYVCVSLDRLTLKATLKGWSDLTRCNTRLNNWRKDWRKPCFGMHEDQLFDIRTLPATLELIAHQKQVA
jgi:hypothetical protein